MHIGDIADDETNERLGLVNGFFFEDQIPEIGCIVEEDDPFEQQGCAEDHSDDVEDLGLMLIAPGGDLMRDIHG